MGKALAPQQDAGTAPAGVHIRTFETGRDERALHEVNEASFADHWGFRPVPYETYEAGMYGAERGHDEVRLGVDAQNPTGAVALYESVGMSPHRMSYVFDLGTADTERATARPT
jgi:hypothetical protein